MFTALGDKERRRVSPASSRAPDFLTSASSMLFYIFFEGRKPLRAPIPGAHFSCFVVNQQNLFQEQLRLQLEKQPAHSVGEMGKFILGETTVEQLDKKG